MLLLLKFLWCWMVCWMILLLCVKLKVRYWKYWSSSVWKVLLLKWLKFVFICWKFCNGSVSVWLWSWKMFRCNWKIIVWSRNWFCWYNELMLLKNWIVLKCMLKRFIIFWRKKKWLVVVWILWCRSLIVSWIFLCWSLLMLKW